MVEDPNLLRRDILSTFDPAIIGGSSLQRKITELAVDFPIFFNKSDRFSQNRHMFSHIIQELNRKLDKFGFSDQIVHPIDAGFRPLDGFYDDPGCFMLPRIIPFQGHGWGVKSLVSIYEFDGATAPVDPKVMQVQRPGGGSSNIKDFKASEVENGTLLSWVTENDANADGGVRILYDQGPQDPIRSPSTVYTDTYDFHQYYSVQQPKIVINGALSRDPQGKVALNGNGQKCNWVVTIPILLLKTSFQAMATGLCSLSLIFKIMLQLQMPMYKLYTLQLQPMVEPTLQENQL